MAKTVSINGKEYPVYATVDEADAYFAGFFNSKWDSISDDDKAKLLVSATRSIDRMQFAGKKVDPEQPLKFPRIIYCEQTCDKILAEACFEEAISVYNYNTAFGSDISGVKSMKVQDTSIEFSDGNKENQFKSVNTYNLLYPYFEFGAEVGYC